MPDHQQPEKPESRTNLSNLAWTASLLASMALPMIDRTELQAAEISPAPVSRTTGAIPLNQQDLLNISYATLNDSLPVAKNEKEIKTEVVAAPDFSLKDLDGNTISLSETLKKNEGKVVLLKFGASWCPPCRASTEQLKELHEKYGKQLIILDVNNRESLEVATRYAADHGVKYKTLLDSDGSVGRQYGVTGLPTFALVKMVDSEAKVVMRKVGYDSSSEAKQEFEAAIVKNFHPEQKEKR